MWRVDSNKQIDLTQSDSKPQAWITRGLQVAALLFVLGAASFAGVKWWAVSSTPVDLDYAERWHAYCAQQCTLNGDHVGASFDPPHNVLPYPPVGYFVNSVVGRIAGATDAVEFRDLGRYVSLFMTFIAAVMMFFLTRSCGAGMFPSMGAGVLFLATTEIHMFASSLRPDALALGLALTGVYLGLGRHMFFMSGIAIALSFLTKHSFIMGGLTVLFYSISQRSVWCAGRFILGGLIGSGVVIAAAGFLLGSYWFDGMMLQGFHGANFKQLVGFIGEGTAAAPLALAAGCVCLVIPRLPSTVHWITIYFILTLTLNSIAFLKPGAAMNYYLEPVAVGCVIVGWLGQQLLAERGGAMRTCLWALIAVLTFPMYVTQATECFHALKVKRFPIEDNREELLAVLREVNSPILADESWIYFDSGHEVWNFPPDLTHTAFENGLLNDSSMIDILESGHFTAIVTRQNWKDRPFFPAEWIRTIENKYELKATLSDRFLFVSKEVVIETEAIDES